MPGFLLTQLATIACAHAGTAMPVTAVPTVLADGAAVVALSTPYTVAGCPVVPPAVGPCVTATWVVGTTRVMSKGQPLLIDTGVSVCAPTGTPLMVQMTQSKVRAT